MDKPIKEILYGLENLELWQLQASLVEFKGLTFVRFKHLKEGAEGNWCLSAKGEPSNFKDFDPGNFLKNEKALESARYFQKHFGFNLPLPMKPVWFEYILGLKDFPKTKKWEETFPNIPYEQISANFQNYFKLSQPIRTFDEYIEFFKYRGKRLLNNISPLGEKTSIQNISVYARLLLNREERVRRSLEAFWGECPKDLELERILDQLREVIDKYLASTIKVKKQIRNYEARLKGDESGEYFLK